MRGLADVPHKKLSIFNFNKRSTYFYEILLAAFSFLVVCRWFGSKMTVPRFLEWSRWMGGRYSGLTIKFTTSGKVGQGGVDVKTCYGAPGEIGLNRVYSFCSIWGMNLVNHSFFNRISKGKAFAGRCMSKQNCLRSAS